MKQTKLFTIVVMVFSIILLVSPANATDGYFSHGQGTVNKGFAGAGVAFLNSPFSAAINPAGIGFFNNGNKKWGLEVSAGIFNPNREYTVTGNPTPPTFWGNPNVQPFVNDTRYMAFGLAPGTVESENKYMLIPAIAFTYKMNDHNILGLNFFGNGGMNTEYKTKTYFSSIINSFGNPMPDGNPNPMANVTEPTGVDIVQMFLAVTYTRTFGDNHSIGISPLMAYQTFEATGLQAFRDMGMAGMPGLGVNRMDKVTNNGSATSTGFGFRVGYQGEIIPGLRLGATYQSKINMSEFDDYAGLFAEEGDFDIPSNWTAGFSYDLTDDFTFMADAKQIMYTDVKSVSNPMDPQAMQPMVPNPNWDGIDPNTAWMPNPNFVALGDADAAGFGWDDMMVFKLGAEYRGIDGWKFRGGFSFGDQPIADSEVMFNILAPAVIENHISFGATKTLGDNELSIAVTRALSNSVEGVNPFDPGQKIEIKMDQWEFELGFAF